MFGFGKKKEQDAGGAPPGASQDEKDILAKVIFHTMPKVGGEGDLALANTESKAASVSNEAQKKEEKKEKSLEKPVERPSLAPPPPSPPPASSKPAVTPPPLLTGAPPAPHGAAKIILVAPSGSKKWVFIAIGVFILFLAGGGGWYWYRTTRAASFDEDRGTITLSPGATEGESVSEPASSVVTPAETELSASLTDNFLVDRGLTTSRDSDADLLTDAEEVLFGTDPGLPDTDRDGWPDGWELVHLYDPAQGAAQRLTDNLRMTGFQNEEYGYAFLYPKAWVVQPVDTVDTSEVVITTETGEFIRVSAEPYGDHAFGTLEEGYLRDKYPGGSTYTLHPFTNKFNVRGFETADALTVFFEGKNTLYTIRYMPGLRTEINFKRTMAMLIAGFFVDEGVPLAIKPLIYNPGVAGFAQTPVTGETATSTEPFVASEVVTSTPASAPATTSTSFEESTTTSSEF